jgi:hypothetical protein
VITEKILAIGGWLFGGVIGALPKIPVPSWVSSSDGLLGQVFSLAGSMGAWVPLGLLGTVLVGLLTIHVASFGIKLARIVASFFTAGGGSAA